MIVAPVELKFWRSY